MLIPQLNQNVSPESRHSYYTAALNFGRNALKIEDDIELRQALVQTTNWAEQQIEELLIQGREFIFQIVNCEPRFYWQSADWGRVWLDDKMVTINGEKFALYWKLGIGKEIIILPPSLPFFVGQEDQGIVELPFFQDGTWIEFLYNLITQKAFEGQLRAEFEPEILQLVRERYRILGGRFYLDCQNSLGETAWSLHWNRRHRELPRNDNEFLLSVIERIKDIAEFRLTCQQVWDWLDEEDTSFLSLV